MVVKAGPQSQSAKELELWNSNSLEFQYFGTVVLEWTLESPLDCKQTKPVNLKGNQPFIRRTDAEAEVPIL